MDLFDRLTRLLSDITQFFIRDSKSKSITKGDACHMSCCWSDIDVFDDAVHEVNEKSPVVHFPRDVVVSDAARFVDDKRQVEEAV